MSATDATVRYEGMELSHHASGTISFGWWGMVWLICTEAMLFGSLIVAYFYLRFTSGPRWPPAGIEVPELTLPLLMTAVLWSSSIPVHIADRAVRRGDQTKLKLGLAAGFVLGATFLGLQLLVEYPEQIRHVRPTDNAYGSLFFALTGLHGSHVLVGLIFNLWTQARAWTGAFGPQRHTTVQNFALYWHFVDAVWAAVLATIYLSPSL